MTNSRKDARERGGAARAESPSPSEGTIPERVSLSASGVCGGRNPEDETVWYVGNCSKCGRVRNWRSVCTELYLWKGKTVVLATVSSVNYLRCAEKSRRAHQITPAEPISEI